MEEIIVFVNRSVNKEFTTTGTYIAIGKNCERVKEVYENGGTLIVLNDVQALTPFKGEEAALYVNGKPVFKGSLEEAYRKYTFYQGFFTFNEELIKKNKKVLEKIKKGTSEIKLRMFKILDENGKERYVFEPTESIRIIAEFVPTGSYTIHLKFYRKPAPFLPKEKASEIIKKCKDGKLDVKLRNPMIDGDYTIGITIEKDGKEIDFGENYFEISVRKPI